MRHVIYWFSRLDKKEKALITPKNEDDQSFHYAANVVLIYGEIKWNPERVSNIKPFISKNNYDGIKYLSKIDH